MGDAGLSKKAGSFYLEFVLVRFLSFLLLSFLRRRGVWIQQQIQGTSKTGKLR